MKDTRDARKTLQDDGVISAGEAFPVPVPPRPRTREDWDREHAELLAWIETQPDLAAGHQAGRERDFASEEARAHERALQRAGMLPLPGTWWGHLVWLHREFGDRPFTAGQVCDTGFDDPEWASPPGLTREELASPAGARLLGMLYASAARRIFEGARIDPGPVTHGVRKWAVTVKQETGA